MTKILNKIIVITTVVLVLALTSCLKDSDYSNNWIGTKNTQDQNFVEVHLTSADNTNFVSRAYPLIGRDTTIVKFIAINLTSGPASKNVTITFQYLNESNSLVIDSLVNIEGWVLTDSTSTKVAVLNQNSVTIPAGSSTGYISVKLNPNNLIGDTYVMGIRITGVSDSKYKLSNLTDGIVKFGPANKYDGEYRVDGTMVDFANATLTGAYPFTAQLVTQSLYANAMRDPKYFGDYIHLILSGTSVSGYGQFSPQFTFDNNDNVISVVNYWPNATNGRKGEIDPSGINKFDPITRTLSVSYWMNQPAVITPHRTHFEEVFTYVGPR